MNKYHNEKAMYVKKVRIIVADLARSLAFYQTVIGLSLIRNTEGEAELGADGKNVLLVLKEVKGAKKASDNIGLYHFAFLLPERSSFAQILKHLIDINYPLTGLSDHGISEAIYLQDPDNNGIEIAVDRYDENGNVYKLTSFGPRKVDVYELMNHLPKEPFTKLPENTIMGHLHLHVNNMNKARSFFVDALGFEVQFAYHDVATFTSTLGYHHHIAFNIWNGTEAKPRGLKQTGLESYVLSVPKDALESIKKRLSDLGYIYSENDLGIELFDVNQDCLIIEVHE